MSSEIKSRVIQVVASIAESKSGTTADQITLQTEFGKLALDSLDFVDLVMRLEGEFKIEISDSVASKMKTVGDIVEYIQSALHTENGQKEEA
ncbi:Acyl carrier protein [Candidatus Cyrtobacter comes]|uniref:Acyl carrier protein n=1 Tax=Candidatus Cyrtobacter comes TaxID=675776 RepID=A0ABU5L6F6_9RICK|nr:acyl carrier protein [Candidatus Cyrtobacter comes]MDZ5761706.1 Acyl carrier protein [Candidatus Cyrtobacter comes]